MTKLSWDKPSERRHESGLDRGVLYPPGESGIAWNGLMSVDTDNEDSGTTPLYFDGVKTLDLVSLGNSVTSIKAVTYPDEFIEFSGMVKVNRGVFLNNQKRRRFNLSYRTIVTNDATGRHIGYKIHILYNLTATPQAFTSESQSNVVQPIEFVWDAKSVPVKAPGYAPTAHIVIDTQKINQTALKNLEETLYGTNTTDPSLPSLENLILADLLT